jgi:hypothetical protein
MSQFSDQKYILKQNVLPAAVCEIATTYALLKQRLEFNPEQNKGRENTHAVYADTLMESILLYLQPTIEEATQIQVYPTYSYYRVYRTGDSLPLHTDRVECEISATLCLGFKYEGVGPTYNWGMFAQVGEQEPVQPVCLPGDMVVYRGRDVKHWREPFAASNDSYQVQAFLHYVDINGPYADRKFDRRPAIGCPISTKNSAVS